jgi:ABC-type polysaccharide/polyol phosphate transport system ATPase subunit
MALVHLEGVHVDFPIYGAQRSLRTAILHRATGGVIERRGKHQERVVVRALSDVSMRLEDGDRLGLIGHNGSGKSTLLKVIAGIYQPIGGRITVQGRITPLLDMMPGLDLEDTGYENVVTAGTLLGMTRKEFDKKIPEIEEFSELGEYLALPVRTYSSGMILRLGFSLVTALEPGILLMDEGFSTGDARFTERAINRMNDFIGRSQIIVLASHSDDLIKSMCNKAALMQEGRLLAFGSTEDVVEEYRSIVQHGSKSANSKETCNPANACANADSTTPESQSAVPANSENSIRDVGACVDGDSTMPESQSEVPVYSENSIRDVGLFDRLTRTSGAVRFTKAVARDEEGQTRWVYRPGETIAYYFEYEIIEPIQNLSFYFMLYRVSDNSTKQEIVSDLFEVLSTDSIPAGQTRTIDVTIRNVKLMPGSFYLYVCLGDVNGQNFHDVIDTNVALPATQIKSEQARRRDLYGCLSLDYEVQQSTQKKVAVGSVHAYEGLSS